MTDERTIPFQRGSETWTLNVEFDTSSPDWTIGDVWACAYVDRVTFLNPNTRRWTPFALSAAEFRWVESQVQP